MDPLAIFRNHAAQLFWQRIDDARVSGRPSGEAIESEKAYVVVRLAEMYLGTTRQLWRKRSPLVHAFITAGAGNEQHAVAGPGQLQDLGGTNLDRVVVLNQRLVGPIPYRGEELMVLAGLYSVAREDTAAALVSTVATLSNLLGPTAVAASEIVKVLKTGVDSILGLGETELRIGINDTFSQGNPLRSGFHVGIAAPAARVSTAPLWIVDGQLKRGQILGLADPYTDHDYFVIEIERLERRPDWPALPGLEKYRSRFSAVLTAQREKPAINAELNAMWPEFREALLTSAYVTRADAEAILTDTQVDLKKRVDAIVGEQPFETRSWGAELTEELDPLEVDFAAVPEATAADRAAAMSAPADEPF